MKVLVTGGAGFIGSHLVKRLVKDGHEVIVLDNLLRGNKLDRDVLPKIKLVREDVRNLKVVNRLACKCNFIYHFAAVLGVDIVADEPVLTMETESIGLQNVASAALQHSVKKIIYASTSGVYGHTAIKRSVTEDIQLNPQTSYAIAKRYNEIYLSALYEQKGLESISLRFFNVYGPGQDNRMVIPRFIEQARSQKPITVYGEGKQSRDFTYIDDAVESTIRLANKSKGCEVFNVCHEQDISIMKLAEFIKALTGSSSPIVRMEVPKKRYDFEVEKRMGNSQKLLMATGYRPSTSLKAGLKKMVNSNRTIITEGR